MWHQHENGATRPSCLVYRYLQYVARTSDEKLCHNKSRLGTKVVRKFVNYTDQLFVTEQVCTYVHMYLGVCSIIYS
jgi:hypothetical protein